MILRLRQIQKPEIRLDNTFNFSYDKDLGYMDLK